MAEKHHFHTCLRICLDIEFWGGNHAPSECWGACFIVFSAEVLCRHWEVQMRCDHCSTCVSNAFSSLFSLHRLYPSKTLSTFLGCLVFWHLIGLAVSYDSFCFCCVNGNFFFISSFIVLSLLPFLLMSLARRLSISFIFWKNQLWLSLIFSTLFHLFPLWFLWSLWFF